MAIVVVVVFAVSVLELPVPRAVCTLGTHFAGTI